MKTRSHFLGARVQPQALLSDRIDSAAFTMLELLCVIGMVAFLVTLAKSGLARTQPGTRSAQCLSNTRALMGAWQMYARDYDEKMVVAVHGGAAQGGSGDPTWGVGWASGWLDWSTSSDNTNTLLLTDARYAKLGKYLPQTGCYRCPADTSLSSAQVAVGWVRRSRSYSENIYIGAGNAEAGPTDFIYKHITRTSEFVYPPPAQAWVFTEEHPDSINDPSFFAPHQTSWIDIPAPFHNGATTFAFADGHGEMHRWEGSLSKSRATQITLSSFSGVPSPVGDPDIHWFSYHSVRVSANSY